MAKLILKVKHKFTDKALFDFALNNLKANINPHSFLFNHLLSAAFILKEMGFSDKTAVSVLLQEIPLEKILFTSDISEKEQKEITWLIKKIKSQKKLLALEKKLKKKPLKQWRKIILDTQAENVRKMFLVLSESVEPIFALLALKLNEMRDINKFAKETRPQKALEALEIFAPLAYGLGAMKIKGELEDLAFPQLYFKEYQWLRENSQTKYQELEKTAQNMKPLLEDQLKKEGIAFLDIKARGKHFFSLYQKLLRHNMDLEKIYDLVALRIIVPKLEDCYKTLGAIHKIYQPLPGRIKDYIASPKQNGYKALHTTVYCASCKRYIEIQIKTKEMDKEAEYGSWGHFTYKQKGASMPSSWMETLRKWQEQGGKEKELSALLKNEIFKDKIFVFTPKKEIIELPTGSTAIDFAFAVHSDIGEHCQGAKINGKMSPLNKPLKTGQVIEIITNKNKNPSFDWLRFVQTNKAKNKIKAFFEKATGIALKKDDEAPEKKSEASKPSIKDRLFFFKKIISPKKRETLPLIGGQKGIAYKIAQCCSPKPGEDMLAFITKGEGASLHKANCKNIILAQKKWPQRVVSASWSS